MNEHEERVLHLVGEDTRYRGENQKQFRREDGMRESVVYDHPVHYKKDRAWERHGELPGSGAGDRARRGKDGIPYA